jgi:hypothetical protein
MKRWLLRIGMAWMLAFGGLSGTAMAQDYAPPRLVPVAQFTAAQPVSQGYIPSEPAGCACRGDTQDCSCRRPTSELFNRAGSACTDHIIGCLNRYGLGCMATHNSHGCGSTYAQYLFIFGSCREFFGDPCQPPVNSTQPFGRICTLCGK